MGDKLRFFFFFFFWYGHFQRQHWGCCVTASWAGRGANGKSSYHNGGSFYRPCTLAFLQRRDGAHRVFADHANRVGEGGGGGAYSFLACLSNLTIDHTPLWRRSTVPTPSRGTSNNSALITFLPCVVMIHNFVCLYPASLLFGHLWPPSVS